MHKDKLTILNSLYRNKSKKSENKKKTLKNGCKLMVFKGVIVSTTG